MPNFRSPRPHQTSSAQLSGSRCCLSREASPSASPTARVYVFYSGMWCIVCVCASTKGQTRQIWLDTQEGPCNLSVKRGSSLPNNKIIQNHREEVSFLICVKTKNFLRACFDWWPLCCLCKLASPEIKIHMILFIHGLVSRAVRRETKHCVLN